jgi:hypothetical protein
MMDMGSVVPLTRVVPLYLILPALAFRWAWVFVTSYFAAFGLWRLSPSVIIGIALGRQWIKLPPRTGQAAEVRT